MGVYVREGGNAFITPIIYMDGMNDWTGLLLVCLYDPDLS